MRRTLNIGFLAITLLLTGICVHAVLNSLAMQETLTDQERNVVPGALTMSEMKHHAAEIRMWTLTYIIRGNVTRGGKTTEKWLLEEWTALETCAREHLELGHEVVPNERAVAEMILDLSQRLIVVSARLVDLKDQGASNDELFDELREEFGPPLFYPLREMLDEHAAAHLADVTAVNIAMGNRQSTNVRRTVALSLTGIIIAVIVGLYTDRLFVQFLAKRKRSEKALEEARQKEAWQQVQLMHADRLTTVGRLAAGVAHEINNPLAVLYGTIQRIDAGSILIDVVDQAAVDRMLRVSRRIRDIVSHLLTFARQRANEKTPYDINKLLSETLTLVSSHLVKSGIKLTMKLSESVPVVSVDQQQIQQVFLNLTFNATDAMPDGGELTIATDIAGDQIAISFQDTGCGISQENLGRLFVPFFTTKEVGEGTGLGLSISHGIVRAHEGEIEVKSTPGQGARFDILLPVDGVNPRGQDNESTDR